MMNSARGTQPRGPNERLYPCMVRTSVSAAGSASAAGTSGSVSFADEVIAQIVGLTVLECYGVVGMAATSLTRGVARLLSRDRLTQGVSVRREPAGLAIDLYVVVEFGLNLAEVAANLRSRVKYQVEKLTELDVASLQIHIQGVKRTA
jgi:uncharacterized alkaline shock family protein YloU